MSGFGDQERERIRNQLRETGKELFAQYGLDKTTISELTDAVGIANGTFYRFYDSKERLYFEILREEGERFAREIIAESFEAEEDPEDAIVAFLTRLCELMETNPLFHQLIVDDDFRRLTEQFTDEEMEAEAEESLSYLAPYIEQWQSEGRLRDGDTKVLAGVLGAAKFLPYHKEDYHDDEFYEDVRDAFIETLAAGLVQRADVQTEEVDES
ncbi:TetR/AcrR family transcriptional regulator [Halorussus halophilus]|uniref:TetR/AcrR family transcriptional regulator n=1 Tax=Halorussus halophilus TaxID=2650975 RepID=UPI00130159FC|nr:TetR/AcrR family transcriptional regulator [Halorussus halophilus]